MRSFDLIVIGAGAAGVMAAGVAARRGWRVLLCEKMEKPQRKVRITGKGRCNLTNMRSTTEFLEKVRSSREFFAPALQYFSNRDTVAFFEQIGLPLNTERGERVFPSSGRAWDVATQHIRWCESQGVTIECHTRAVDLLTQNRQITSVLLETPQGREEVQSPRVLLATGGASYPATGSTGDGYGLAHRLGHHIVAIRPSLTPLESSLHGTAQLKGLNLRNITARLLLNGTSVQEEFGEMEFTPWISGAIILRLSRRAVDALIDGDRVEITLDLKPALSEAQIRARLERECSLLPPAAPVTALLRKMVPGPLVSPLLRQGGIPERTPCKML
ncbi:MAG: aminoacetone oxidase family FAD-binding enzyme, partial [Alistipes sp.]|nr:aminoacetone oxidase family FAD-binding enzyme [Alistipes sp.]